MVVQVPSRKRRRAAIKISVPLSVLFRSSRFLVIGGPFNTTSVPSGIRPHLSVTGHIGNCCRHQNCISRIVRVIAQLSHSAANIVLFTERKCTRTLVSALLHGGRISGACQTVLSRPILARPRKFVSTPVNEARSSVVAQVIERSNGRTLARC